MIGRTNLGTTRIGGPNVSRPLNAPGVGGGGFDPASLFGGGEQGLIYDLSNASSLYVDSARTTPVTTAGDLIGSVSDLSPNGLDGSQANDANKPAWQTTYALFGGTNDFWQTALMDLSGTDALTVIVGVRKLSDAATASLIEQGNVVGAAGSGFAINAPHTASGNSYQLISRGTASSSAIATPYASPVSSVVTGIGDISSDTCIVRVDGAQVATSATDQGTGNYRSAALYIGMRVGAANPFNGRVYRVIVIGRHLTADELANAEAWAGDPF